MSEPPCSVCGEDFTGEPWAVFYVEWRDSDAEYQAICSPGCLPPLLDQWRDFAQP